MTSENKIEKTCQVPNPRIRVASQIDHVIIIIIIIIIAGRRRRAAESRPLIACPWRWAAAALSDRLRRVRLGTNLIIEPSNNNNNNSNGNCNNITNAFELSTHTHNNIIHQPMDTRTSATTIDRTNDRRLLYYMSELCPLKYYAYLRRDCGGVGMPFVSGPGAADDRQYNTVHRRRCY
jgi:hypothetical protein